MIVLMSEEELATYPVAVLSPEFASRGPGKGADCRHCDAYRPEPQLSGNLQVDPEIHLPSPGMDVDIAYYFNSSTYPGSPFINGPYGYQRIMSPAMAAQFFGIPMNQVILER